MPIDQVLFNSGAVRGDISGTAIAASVALSAIAQALEDIGQTGAAKPEDIQIIRAQADRLEKIFDQLTGYTP